MPFLESQTCNVTGPWALFFSAPRPVAAFRQRQALSTWLPGFLMLLVHSGCTCLWISPFILRTNGALQTDESHSKQRGNLNPHFGWAVWKVYNGSSPMSSMPQTSVLSVSVQALLTAKAPAAGQHQPRRCQHLAAIPLWSHKHRKLWGLYKVSVSDNWKGKTSLHPCNPQTEKEDEFLSNY